MRHRVVPVLLFAVLLGLSAAAQEHDHSAEAKGAGRRGPGPGRGTTMPAAPAEVQPAMKELWRRGACLLSSVYQPAERDSVVPADLGPLPAAFPHTYGGKGAILCYATDGRMLWAADDQALYRIDTTTSKLDACYPAAHAIESAIQSIAPAGAEAWLATRSGLARLREDRLVRVGLDFTLGRVIADGAGGCWVLSDAGAYRAAAGEVPRKLPDFPGQPRLADLARKGFWSALWQNRLGILLPALLATEDGLYAIALNQFLRFDPKSGQWTTIAPQAWQLTRQGRAIWAMTTTGVARFDPASGSTETFAAGKGPAAGRPVAMAATASAFYLVSQPDYDSARKQYVGGGISRYADKQWTITDAVDGTDIRFLTAILADGDGVWAACKLYDRIVEIGAHPGMAHVKKWLPHPSGIGLLRQTAGGWQLIKRENLKSEPRWVLGQQNTLGKDQVGPETAEQLVRTPSGLWGTYRVVPERWYGGYFFSAGRLAEPAGAEWKPLFEQRTDELRLGGEQPEVMLVSLSHGEQVVLADGHPTILGHENLGGRLWSICQSGIFAEDAATKQLRAIVAEQFRTYWRATAAVADRDGVWIGGDGGTISRWSQGRVELVGVVPGRSIVALASDGQRLTARTARTSGRLPLWLRGAKALPEADILQFDGKEWSAAAKELPATATAWRCADKGNWLLHGGRRAAYLKGSFRPAVLCEDTFRHRLWLATYEGIACIAPPAVPATQPAR